MATRKVIYLSVDTTQGRLRDASTNRTLTAAEILLYARDGHLLCFTFQEYVSSAWTATVIPETALLRIGMKEEKDDTTFLAESDNDDWNVSGDWADASRAGGKCCARLSLNTAEIETLFSSTTEDQTVWLEVSMQESGEDPVTLAQAQVTVKLDVITGDEGDPAPAGPTYYTQAEVDALLAAYVTTAKVSVPDGMRLVVGADGSITVEEIT